MDKKNNNSNKIKIGIDGRLWAQTGVGRYIRNICLNLQKIDQKNNYVLFVRNEDKKDVEREISEKNWRIVSGNIKWHSLKDQFSYPKLIKNENVDLMHFPYFDVPFFYKKPYVITIHDLVYHHFMTGKASTNAIWLYGFKMLAYKTLINFSVKNAKRIIAVSNSTRDEIFDHLLVNKNKVEVIYEAADDFKIDKLSKDSKLGKYFIYVGNVYPHKNADNLIRAFEKLVKEKDVKLIFIGKKDYFYDRLKKGVSKLIRENKILVVEDANDRQLATYYAYAIALVRPSFMEGFSLPPLEAMSSGSIVLASDIPVHKEIFGDSIIYFNPKDSVDIKEKMLYVLNLNDARRQEIIKKGKELVGEYSWEKAARQTLKVYESSTSKSSV